MSSNSLVPSLLAGVNKLPTFKLGASYQEEPLGAGSIGAAALTGTSKSVEDLIDFILNSGTGVTAGAQTLWDRATNPDEQDDIWDSFKQNQQEIQNDIRNVPFVGEKLTNPKGEFDVGTQIGNIRKGVAQGIGDAVPALRNRILLEDLSQAYNNVDYSNPINYLVPIAASSGYLAGGFGGGAVTGLNKAFTGATNAAKLALPQTFGRNILANALVGGTSSLPYNLQQASTPGEALLNTGIATGLSGALGAFDKLDPVQSLRARNMQTSREVAQTQLAQNNAAAQSLTPEQQPVAPGLRNQQGSINIPPEPQRPPEDPLDAIFGSEQTAPVAQATPRKAYSNNAFNKATELVPAKIKQIMPALGDKVRSMLADLSLEATDYYKQTLPFQHALGKLSPEQNRKVKGFMLNGDFEGLQKWAQEIGLNDLTTGAQVWKDLAARAKEAGIPLEEIDNYFPRRLTKKAAKGLTKIPDVVKLLSQAKERKGEKLTLEEMIDISRKYHEGKLNPARHRTRQQVADDQLDQYEDLQKVIPDAINGLTEAIVKQEFRNQFGKGSDASSIIQKLALKDKSYNRENDIPLYDALQSILKPYKQTPWQIKAAQLATRIAYFSLDPTIVTTQLGGITNFMDHNGITNAIAGILRKNKLDPSDFNMRSLNPEKGTPFSPNRIRDTILDGFLDFGDQIEKSTAYNSSFEYLKNQAIKNPEQFLQQQKGFFGKQTKQALKDFQNDEVTKLTRKASLIRMSDRIPTSRYDMPQYFLEHPNARIVYNLQSYTLKNFDYLRNHIIRKFSKEPKKAALNLVKLATIGFSGQVASNIISQKVKHPEEETNIPQEYLDTTLSQTPLANRFGLGQLSRGDVTGFLGNKALPGLATPLSAVIKDAGDLIFNGEMPTRSLKFGTGIGKALYAHETGEGIDPIEWLKAPTDKDPSSYLLD